MMYKKYMKRRIQPEDWGFFEDVSRAAFANPFGRARDELDLRIGGYPKEIPPGPALQAALGKIKDKLEGFSANKGELLGSQEGRRREILKGVILFHVFHGYIEDFDAHIAEQERKGGPPVAVSFAGRALKELRGYGLPEEEALRFFAFFYQLRRGFYFIRNGLAGSSPAMTSLRMRLWNAVFTHDVRWFEAGLWNRMEDFSILLVGETGTGKGASASAIGKSGFIPFDPRKNAFAESFTRNFVSINLSQYAEGVIESELFGHKKGAFTGAMEEHEGLFARCPPHGVIFLDEIGDVRATVQIKLLQVLQERIFFPVGSHEPRRFGGRVVAATNRPLDELRAEGSFRDDLYYRLSSDVIRVPTLRERLREDPGELDVLLENILGRITGGIKEREIHLLKKVLQRDAGPGYQWPGNVRELEQAVRRIILTGHFCPRPAAREEAGPERSLAARMSEGKLTAEEMLASYAAMLYEKYGSYEEVARRAGIDRRTARKHVQKGMEG